MSDSEIIFIVEESPEGGYEAKALGQSIFTQAESLDDLKTMVQDAVRCHSGPTTHEEINDSLRFGGEMRQTGQPAHVPISIVIGCGQQRWIQKRSECGGADPAGRTAKELAASLQQSVLLIRVHGAIPS